MIFLSVCFHHEKKRNFTKLLKFLQNYFHETNLFSNIFHKYYICNTFRLRERERDSNKFGTKFKYLIFTLQYYNTAQRGELELQ